MTAWMKLSGMDGVWLMRKIQFVAIILIILFSSAFITGCTLIAGEKQVYFYERPAIGFTVEDEVTTNVDLQEQNSLSVSAKDGVITITLYDGDTLQIVEKRKLTGPSSKKALKAMLEKNKLGIEKGMVDVRLKNEAEGKQKPFFRFVDDMELRVPKAFTNVDVAADSGGIEASGLSTVNIVSLKINKGNIKIENCNAYVMHATIIDGNLEVHDYIGSGTYQCGRGNLRLLGIKGNIDLSSLSGDSVIEKSEGRLNCDISTGSLKIVDSHMKKDSVLYASYGEITADLKNIEPSGKYSIKTSNGDIKLTLPETAGWSLIARSTNGRITENPGLHTDELKKSPTGELYGDVRGGGPYIDVYTDMGNIILD